MGRYVGITGFRTPEEVAAVHRVAKAISECASSASIGYGLVFYLRNRNLALSLDELHRLCRAIRSSDTSGKTIVHLNEWGASELDVERALELAHFVPSSVSIQINKFDWQSHTLRLLKKIFPLHQLILPYHPRRVDVIECISVIERNYQAIDSLLIDASEGKGELCDVIQVATIVSKLRAAFPMLSLGVAGGLGTRSAAHLVPQLRKLAPLSVDAETGLWKDGEIVLKGVADYLTVMSTLSSYNRLY